jgi:aminobenzoyl-glutamate transport protein
MVQAQSEPKGVMQKFLDVVEKVGNKVPHPVIIFLILIGIVITASHVAHLAGLQHVHEVVVTEPAKGEASYKYDSGTAAEYRVAATDETKAKIETRTTAVRSLLTTEGIRFM